MPPFRVLEFAPGLCLEGRLVVFQGCYLLFQQSLQQQIWRLSQSSLGSVTGYRPAKQARRVCWIFLGRLATYTSASGFKFRVHPVAPAIPLGIIPAAGCQAIAAGIHNPAAAAARG